MSTSATIPTTTEQLVRPASSSGRIRLVAGAVAIGAVTVAGLVLTHPWGDRVDSSSDDVLNYNTLQPHRGAAWSATLVDNFAYAVVMVCLAIGVCYVVRARGRIGATIGSVLLVAGGVVYAMGGFAFASIVWFGTGLPKDQSQEFLAFANDHAGRLVGVEAGGFVLITLGTLTVAGALVRAKVVPWLAAAVFVALTVALFVGLPMTAMNIAQAAQVLMVGAVAVPIWRSAAA
jgi:hypothetical protein